MPDSPPVPGAPQPGELIAGKYRVEKVIGVGGMGTVVSARHAALGQRVAIKVLNAEAAHLPEAVARFLREARAAAAIESEHVCKVLDVGETGDGRPFMVMELLTGMDLGQLLETSGPRQADEAVELLLQACEAIAHAHAAGIIHRDLKPSNLFLTHRGDGSACVKVLDFGISKMTRETDAAVTAASFAFGTPLYMSPEQIRSLKTVDGRADIWALGVILHQLMTAQQPFDGVTLTALCAAIATDVPTPLRAQMPNAPAGLEAVVAKCLQKVPANRYATVAELASALKPYAPPSSEWLVDRVAQVVAGAPAAIPQPVGSGAVRVDGRVQTRSAWGRTRSGSAGSQRVLVAIAASAMMLALGGIAFLAWPRAGSTAPGGAASSNDAPRASAAPNASDVAAPSASVTSPPAPGLPASGTAASSSARPKRTAPVRNSHVVDPLQDRR